jgi:DNA-binding CsgD family transcriptional regulator
VVDEERAQKLSAAPASLVDGWAALARGAWQEAYALFQAELTESGSAGALEGLSWAAWWLNDADALFDARERAYHLYRSEGDLRGAARMATWLGTDHVDFRGEIAVAQGWLARARRLLEDVEPGLENGWLCVHEGEKFLLANNTARAREAGARAAELGRRWASTDLEMMGLATEGLALVTEGELAAGMARLDEAAAAAFGGEFSELWAIAWCGCFMLYACERARDYERATEWCRRIEEWSERMDMVFVHRICRAHYAGVLIWHGTWERAEELLADAAERLTVVRPPMTGEALVRLGELRRRQGRLHEAQGLFEAAAEHPLALLGFGELCLDREDPSGAHDRAQQYLRELPRETGAFRAPALELLVRSLAALGMHAEAESALEELEAIARRVQTEPMRGSARFAAGTLAAATGRLEAAQASFEDAVRHFQRSGAPFEAGRSRLELARVLAGLGRSGDARRERRAAVASLERIGAAHEVARANALDEGERSRTVPSVLTAREREVLALIAAGKPDRAIAQALVVSEHTVHRHVANILAKLDSRTRSAAVAEALRRELL